jgi:ATP synthase protein I
VAGRTKHPALAVCCIQLALLLPVALVLVIVSKVVAYSALLGGALFILPNAYFTAYAFRYSGADSAPRVAQAIVWGETGKLALTIVGFAIVLHVVQPLSVPALMITYALMITSNWFIAHEVTKRMTD